MLGNLPPVQRADEEQIERVLDIVRTALGEQLVSAYLFGSAVLGGLKPSSDVDLLAVVRRTTTVDERRRLVEALLPVSGRDGRRHAEVTTVVASELRPWGYPPRMDFQYGDWLRDRFERGELGPPSTVNPDLTTLLAMVHRNGRTLLGPPAAELFEPVPPEDLRRAVSDVDALLDDLDDDTRNVVLTLARAWSTLETGEIRSKDAAAGWALERLPSEHRPVLEHARAIYLGEADERWDRLAADVRPHADYVVGRIRD
jgi:streptomycin 3"-adenylyltransferase